MTIDPQLLERMKQAAREAASFSYSPYSGFRVGAAVADASGAIFQGTNVENASYGLTMCAERVATGLAASTGVRHLVAVVLYTPTGTPTAPCGACRQVLREFGKEALVHSFCDSAETKTWTVEKLLPDSFGPESLT